MKLSRNLFVKIAVLVFSVFCFVTFITLQLENNSMRDKADSLNKKIQEYETYISDLKNALDAPMDEEYIAEIARTELGLRYPQEVIFYSDDSK